MTLQELKYIVTVAQERHFGRAAKACFVSQPALSAAVRKLEDELGVVLFDRDAPTLAVTPLLVPPLAAGYVYSTYAPGLEIQTNGVAVDSRGWLYVAATADHAIRVFQPNGVAFILAGSPGNSGTADGTGDAARFNSPQGVAVDAAFNVYVADSGNHSIRKITPDGDVTTVAGLSGTSGPSVPETGLTTARFSSPVGLAVDAAGLTIFVADSGNHVVRAIDLTYRAEAQIVTTLAGLDAQKGFADTQLYTPTNVVPFGNKLYVSDLSGAILRIDLDVWSSGFDTRKSYTLVTVAGLRGNPPTGPMPFNQYRNVDGTGSEARFGVRRVAIIHRTGDVPLGQPSIAIVTCSPHRGPAFDAARYAIEEVKARAPIWKAEHFADGKVWIGAPARERARPPEPTGGDPAGTGAAASPGER